MTTWLVTRHPGAVEWARDIGIEVDDRTVLSNLDTSMVRPGDMVVGTLPVHLVADLNERGARYLHLALEVPEHARGRELSADEMRSFGARLEEYHVRQQGSFPASRVTTGGGEIVICIASGQPLANLLPLFMRQPSAIHILETADVVARRTSARIQEVARRVGLPCTVSKDAPSAPLAETKAFGARLVAELKANYPDARIVLNATGGTKLISLGLASQVGPLGEVIYCDMEHDRIEVIAPEGRAPTRMPPDLVNLRLLLMAQGIDIISADSQSEGWMARARNRVVLSQKLATLCMPEVFSLLNRIAFNAEPKFHRGRKLKPFEPEQELGSFPEVARWIIDEIAAFGVWDRKGPDRVVFTHEDSVRYLKGGWLEELAATEMEALCQKAGVPDGHWAAGVKIRPRGTSADANLPFNELDLVVVWRNRLLVVECKTGTQASDRNESMNITNKLKAIGDYLGGPFSSVWLACAQPIGPKSIAAERCRLSGVRIIHPERLSRIQDSLADWMHV